MVNRINIVESNCEPNTRDLWLVGKDLKKYTSKGWESLFQAPHYAIVHDAANPDVEIEFPIASELEVGGVRIMDKEHSHLIIDEDTGNLYVWTTDEYLLRESDSPDMIPTVAALHSLYQDTIGEKSYATVEKYGIVKQAEHMKAEDDELTISALANKLNDLIAKLQAAGIMANQ